MGGGEKSSPPHFPGLLPPCPYSLPCGLVPAPGDMLGKIILNSTQRPSKFPTLPPRPWLGQRVEGKGSEQPVPHSTFVFNSKDFSASPQMSHREEVLCKMTPRIRITISLRTVPDVLPPTVVFMNLIWEKGSLCSSLRVSGLSLYHFIISLH